MLFHVPHTHTHTHTHRYCPSGLTSVKENDRSLMDCHYRVFFYPSRRVRVQKRRGRVCRSTPINRECALMMIFNEFPLMKRAGPLRGRISAFHFFLFVFFYYFFFLGGKQKRPTTARRKKRKRLTEKRNGAFYGRFSSFNFDFT